MELVGCLNLLNKSQQNVLTNFQPIAGSDKRFVIVFRIENKPVSVDRRRWKSLLKINQVFSDTQPIPTIVTILLTYIQTSYQFKRERQTNIFENRLFHQTAVLKYLGTYHTNATYISHCHGPLFNKSIQISSLLIFVVEFWMTKKANVMFFSFRRSHSTNTCFVDRLSLFRCCYEWFLFAILSTSPLNIQ